MNSPLVTYTEISPNQSARSSPISFIVPHCVVGQCTIEALGHLFAERSRAASSNYGIDKDGRVGCFVDESTGRSWCSSSTWLDDRGVTIECASDVSAPWAFRPVVYEKLVELCTDICKRNGKTKLIWLGDKETTLNYKPAADEMLLAVHRWFANKACPGDWMMEHMDDLASRVTQNLSPEEPSEWARVSCQKAIEKGVVSGYGDGRYGWRDNITREQMIVILDRLGLL